MYSFHEILSRNIRPSNILANQQALTNFDVNTQLNIAEVSLATLKEREVPKVAT